MAASKFEMGMPDRAYLAYETKKRLAIMADLRAWVDAAVADGWALSNWHAGETSDTSFQLLRDGYRACGTSRPANENHGTLPSYSLSIWGPDSLHVAVPDVYSWDEIQRGSRVCSFCGASDVPTARVAFASRACLKCQPIEQAALPYNWCD